MGDAAFASLPSQGSGRMSGLSFSSVPHLALAPRRTRRARAGAMHGWL
jgi:hypothetical protein